MFVIGTERHESRRIDNQLRGRAGRQGDPGATQFYLSTDDDLMRIFAGDRIRSVMQTLRVPDDMPIEQKSITRIIESAQRKVEGFHFDSRKHLLEFDDVLNRHREVVYGKRKAILEEFKYQREKIRAAEGGNAVLENPEEIEKPKLQDMILEMVEQELEQVVFFHTASEEKSEWNMQEIAESVQTIYPLTNEEKEKLLAFKNPSGEKLESIEERTKVIEYLNGLAKTKYDGMLIKKVPHLEMMLEIEKQVLLRAIDNLWLEHLVAVDHLRTGIGLRGYGQRDPLVEYKKETYHMFNELLSLIQKEVVYTIYKVSIGIDLAPSVMAKENVILSGAAKTSDGNGGTLVTAPKLTDSTGNEPGRNDLCPCGSGKKYKKCHGA